MEETDNCIIFDLCHVVYFSPSDLEADLEDNQDYDSTVSQSETNLSLIGQSAGSPVPPSSSAKLCARPSPDSTPTLTKPSSQREDLYSRPVSYPSRFREHDPDIENLNLGSLRLRDGHHRESPASPKSVHRVLRSASQESYDVRPPSIINTRARELEKVSW